MNTTSKTWKRIALMLTLALAGVLVGTLGIGGWAVARAYAQRPWGGWGMMGGWSTGDYPGCGMMGNWGGNYPQGTKFLTLDEAKSSVDRYLASWNNSDLEVTEVMEFSNNFYALVKEKSTGLGAFEVLVDKATGAVRPEPGPNMMWNQKYGMMGGRGGMMGGWGGMMGGWGPGYVPTAQMPVTEAQARQNAQVYLDRVMPGATLSEHTATFYGYYTIDVERDGTDVGMLSVNGYSGQVWYHTWHGTFVQEKEWD